jgi:hypothetical protein
VNAAKPDAEGLHSRKSDRRQLVAIAAAPIDDLLHRAVLVIGRRPLEIDRQPADDPLRPAELRGFALGQLTGELPDVFLREGVKLGIAARKRRWSLPPPVLTAWSPDDARSFTLAFLPVA